jgi:hypothetical protein
MDPDDMCPLCGIGIAGASVATQLDHFVAEHQDFLRRPEVQAHFEAAGYDVHCEKPQADNSPLKRMARRREIADAQGGT